MTQQDLQPTDTAKKHGIPRYRVALSVAIGILVIVYIVGVVLGYIPKERQINGVSLAMILVAAFIITFLLRPEVFDRVRQVEAKGFRFELFEVNKKLSSQGSELLSISQMLPLLLPDTERGHLFSLAEGRTGDYQGRSALRAELRRLRSMGLIRMLHGHHVGQMTSGLRFDLAEYVELTDLGKYWVRHISQIEKAAPNEGAEKNEQA